LTERERNRFILPIWACPERPMGTACRYFLFDAELEQNGLKKSEEE